ncbi:ER lumen protein retaining receptor [Nematocida minor]|uniref:ER lumen protein retaining receptor n=1 Tax=Nematocida minor TaxID=1912983 RepID=UPI002220D259|nr:ER lumen protein retaining receptor [Nematocida minor]KAI5191078.1 ER lumen protein retaining receptor [Nematocida minor]
MSIGISLEGIAAFIFRTTGDILHVLSMLVLIVKMKRTRSCSGISLKSQILYLTVYVWRYLDIIFFLLYPRQLFSSNRMIYNGIMKILFTTLQSHIIYKMVHHYFYSYDNEYDDTPITYIIAFAFISGGFLFTKPLTNEYRFIRMGLDWLWASSVVLESISILPQLVLLHKAGEGETLTIHYVLFLGMYRFLYMLSWIVNWLIVGKVKSHLLLWGSVLQTLLYSELFIVYTKSFLTKGKRLKVKPRQFLRDALSWGE